MLLSRAENASEKETLKSSDNTSEDDSAVQQEGSAHGSGVNFLAADDASTVAKSASEEAAHDSGDQEDEDSEKSTSQYPNVHSKSRALPLAAILPNTFCFPSCTTFSLPVDPVCVCQRPCALYF